ncbi:unnamed protein product [Heligmosomoides polygyrus]|uniref:Tenascin-X n=1 Tax=Heligmosomoides polygyrus TaxID=6339 RepID=A0A183G7Y1_HELPZ|nr:unnamed protein product [Heligmosomoides polygyrus]
MCNCSAFSIYVHPSRKQCSSGSDCNHFPGADCWHSHCTSGGVRCAYDTDCRLREAACIYARCIRLYQPCRVSADCPLYPVTSCRGSVCVKQLAQSRECSSQYDCLQYPGTVCSYGRCERAEEIDCVRDLDCPSGTVCRDRRCVRRRPSHHPSQGSECRSDTDCLSLPGTYCVKGRCLLVEQIGCRTDGDCPPEAQCVNGRCSKKSQSNECRTDSDCRLYPGTYCVAGKCLKAEEISCSTDNDCPPGTWCINGKCAKMSQSNACRTDVDCRRYPGTYCVFGKCQKLEDIGCQRDSDCPAGAQCVDQKCRKQERCAKDEDCLLYPRMSCINSMCVTVRRPCTQDSDCPYRPHTACIASRCEKVRQPCKQDTDCVFYPDVKCIAGYCAKDGEKCTVDRDCPNYPATRCVASKCVAVGGSCSKDEECPAYPYLECTNSKCQKVPAPCRSDNDCDQKPLRECIYELCIKRRYCNQTWDCPFAPEVPCKGNQCVSLVGKCNSDADCAVYGSRRYCIKTTCKGAPENNNNNKNNDNDTGSGSNNYIKDFIPAQSAV